MSTSNRMTHAERDPVYRQILMDMLELGDMELQALRLFQQRILNGQKLHGTISPEKKDWLLEQTEELADSSVYGLVKILQLLGPEGRKKVMERNATSTKPVPEDATLASEKKKGPSPATIHAKKVWGDQYGGKLWERTVERWGKEKASTFTPKRAKYLLSGGTFGKLHREGKTPNAKGNNGKTKAVAKTGTGHPRVIKRVKNAAADQSPESAVITNPQAVLNGHSGSGKNKTGAQA